MHVIDDALHVEEILLAFRAGVVHRAFEAIEPRRHVAGKDCLGFHRDHPHRRLADQEVEVVQVVRRLLQPETTGQRFVAHPAVVVVRAVERHIVDRLDILDRADDPTVEDLLRHHGQGRHAQREGDDHRTLRRQRRGVKLRNLCLVDRDRLLEEERQVPLQHLDRIGRVVEAIGTDEHAVEVGFVEHAVDVLVERHVLELIREPLAQRRLSGIDGGHDRRAGIECVDCSQHVADPTAIADHAQSFVIHLSCPDHCIGKSPLVRWMVYRFARRVNRRGHLGRWQHQNRPAMRDMNSVRSNGL
jgi:hypothetical protein